MANFTGQATSLTKMECEKQETQKQDYRILVKGPKSKNTIVLRSLPCKNVYPRELTPELEIHHVATLEAISKRMRPDESNLKPFL